mgnify:CR=1 FL=1
MVASGFVLSSSPGGRDGASECAGDGRGSRGVKANP